MHHGKEHMVGGHEREIKEMYESLLVVLEYFPLGNTTFGDEDNYQNISRRWQCV